MLGTRHEEYKHFTDGLPFVLNANIIRTKLNLSAENNWHENLEIQICNEGSGTMLLDGQKITLKKEISSLLTPMLFITQVPMTFSITAA